MGMGVRMEWCRYARSRGCFAHEKQAPESLFSAVDCKGINAPKQYCIAQVAHV